MADFKFLHAADPHLDSPLLGLPRKSQAFAVQLEAASRTAFDNLIDRAIAEGRCGGLPADACRRPDR